MKSRTPLLLAAMMAVGATPSLTHADGFLGLFGKKEEKAMPGQAELDRREAEARALVAKAGAAEAAGDHAKAAKHYLEATKEFPLSSVAPDSAIKSGELYEKAGKPEKAFDSYQEFINRFKADKRFKAAMDRQFAVAMACKEGQFTGSVLGLPIGVSRGETIKMLETIASNAPRSSMAGRALIAAAELHQKGGDLPKAVAAYEKVVDEMPGSKEAEEAQFKIGQAYRARAEQKSKDRTTVTTARRSYEDYLLENPGGQHAADARQQIDALSSKEARETFEIARFYERTKKPQAAAIYYREVLAYEDADLAAQARSRLEALGASGVKIPEPSEDALLGLDEERTKDRDDYAGPPVRDLKAKVPSLRYLDLEKLPAGEIPSGEGSDNPLLDDVPMPPPGTPDPEDGAAPAPAPTEEKPAASEPKKP